MTKSEIKINPLDCIATDEKGVMALLNVGRETARKIGKESGALIKIGRRNLYKVDVLREYLNNL